MIKLSTYNLLKNAKTKNRIMIEGDLLKKMQQILLQTLKDFVAICESTDSIIHYVEDLHQVRLDIKDLYLGMMMQMSL